MARWSRASSVVRTDPLILLALTHGEPSVPNRAAILQLVDAVAAELPESPVSIAFLDARTAEIAGALERHVTQPGSVVVPLVLSAGFHMRTGIASGLDRLAPMGVELAAELGPDDRLVGLLERRVEEAGIAPGDSLVLAAAGSSDPRAIRECFETGRRLAHRLGRPVTVGFIAAAKPRLHDAIEMVREVHPGTRVVVASYLLAPGVFCDAALAAGADLVASPLLLPGEVADPDLVDLVVDRYRSAGSAG